MCGHRQGRSTQREAGNADPLGGLPGPPAALPDYSVPVAYGHQEVWIRGYVHEVVIGCGAGIIARHPRSDDREDMVFDPIHYRPLLEHKIGALDQAAPRCCQLNEGRSQLNV